MFNSKRYMTRGVNEKIPLAIQIYMWRLIDELKNTSTKMDYLQVFELSNEAGCQVIAHKQEQPEYSACYKISAERLIIAKVYIIDDGSHSTMLLAEEY